MGTDARDHNLAPCIASMLGVAFCLGGFFFNLISKRVSSQLLNRYYLVFKY